MSTTYPLQGVPVDGPCTICKREPRDGEVYGPHAEGWDFTGICPTCWDSMMADDADGDDGDDYGLDDQAF